MPLSNENIYQFSKKRNPMNHVAIMFRKQDVMKAGGYIEVHLSEDYYLWVRMLNMGCFAQNINRVLVYVRIGNGMFGRRGGFSYAKDIFQLQKLFFNMRYISMPQFLQNCIVRIVISLVPNQIRQFFYYKFLRSNAK